jgi:hypothetical protein
LTTDDSHAVPASACPICGYVMDAATAADDSGRAPSAGDFSFCIGCAAALRFDDDLRLVPIVPDDLKPLTLAELSELQRVQAATLAVVRRYQRQS